MGGADYTQCCTLTLQRCCLELLGLLTPPELTRGLDHCHAARSFLWLKGKALYFDFSHLDGHTGHKALSELLLHLFQETLLELQQMPLRQDELQHVQQVGALAVEATTGSRHGDQMPLLQPAAYTSNQATKQ